MKKIQNKITVLILFGLILVSGIFILNTYKIKGEKPFFTLVCKAPETSDHHGYAHIIVVQLAKIGIKVDYIVQGWPVFVGELIAFRNFDLAILTMNSIFLSPFFSEFYTENGSLNLFGYHTNMDWDKDLATGKNQWYLEESNSFLPPVSEERIEHIWNWEQYMMDELLLMKPLFSKNIYRQYWDNLEGYNFTEGFLKSWGKMNWNGAHIGQSNTSQIIISDKQWTNLNPLFQDKRSIFYPASSFVSNSILDPLFWLESDYSIKPHLAKSFTIINNTHVRINLREEIKWQTDPDELFPDEYFDAEDVYFTLSCRSNENITQYLPYKIKWLEDIEIIDPYTIDLFIDANPSTEENEPYADFLYDLCYLILPEHYLNQTQIADDTPDITHYSWSTYSTKCFGTGLFELKSNYTGFETILNINPNCWWLNSTINSDPLLDWENRFGSFSSNINQLQIKVHDQDISAMYDFEAGLIDFSPILYSKPEPIVGSIIQEKMSEFLSFVAFNCRETRTILGNSEPCPSNHSITKGLAVRKAIAYGIDREEMNDIINGGKYSIVNNPIHESHTIWCNPNIIHYDYNKELAEYYLELVGFSRVIIGFEIFDLLQISFTTLIVILVFKRKQIKSKL